ncbi:MAG: Gfo/Idh/MocA family oxidoreductase [Fuerstiella sp.]|nr:Gfo/Idh/MocA family oxidoreductase [Fuerstiella sp.]
MTSDVSRRHFIKTSVSTAAASSSAASHGRIAGANERLRIGFIGTGRRGFGTHVKSLTSLRKTGSNIDLVGVCDVFSVHRQQAVDHIAAETNVAPKSYVDHHELLGEPDVDAVCIGTPDHWHARQTLGALDAGKHVYCEKPMTHTIDESRQVVDRWKKSGLVLQVGVQSSSSPLWDMARKMINDGRLGKVVQFQTECFRNGRSGMSRHNVITREMTPRNIDWNRWLGVDEGLAPKMVFDRAVYGKWRCYWPFGYGMFSDLFVHRVTGMLKATGLRMPGRVVGGGGIYMEYDDRQVPDVGSIIADFHEGVQGVVSSTMVSEELKIDHIIRGHSGNMLFQKLSYTSGPSASFDFIPERPQVTLDSKLKKERHEATSPYNFNLSHFDNFISAIESGRPNSVNNDPVLGTAAVMFVNLAIRSYREGKVFHVSRDGQVSDGNSSWADGWEQMSKSESGPKHVAGWKAGDKGSLMTPFEYQNLAGPWVDGRDPAS